MTKPENERLAVLEQKFADLDSKFSDMASDIKAIKDLVSGYSLLKQEIDVMKKEHDEQIREIRSQTGFWKWFSPTVSAVLSAVVTFLVIEYLTQIHK